MGKDHRVGYLTFGVDAGFWTPGDGREGGNEPYVLSIGNDTHRDYATLIAAWNTDFPKLQRMSRLSPETGAARF